MDKDKIVIGAEIEIVYILYENNSYWCKSPCSIFSNSMEKYGNMALDKWCKYFESRCFRVYNKVHVLFDNEYDHYLCRDYFCDLLCDFIGCYCVEIMRLSEDIIIFQSNDSRSLFGRDCYKQLLQAKMGKKEHEKTLLPLETKQERCLRRSKVINKYEGRYSHQNKIGKRDKSYRNNTKKYQYNRW